MKKQKIYLDTSVVSHLCQNDAPEKMQETLTLWEDIKANKYEVYLSDTTLEEIKQCSQPKRDIMINFLTQIEYIRLESNEEAQQVAEQIIETKILSRKNFDDCVHIATAIVNNCDYIVSWNFKHMVNVKTIRGIRGITNVQGYKSIDIIQPAMLTESEEE